jgi:hypothetical protein
VESYWRKLIAENKAAITAILREYSVPLVDERGEPIDRRISVSRVEQCCARTVRRSGLAAPNRSLRCDRTMNVHHAASTDH